MTDPNAHINYSFADIERYLDGGMTANEMHDLERAALQDPFLADAIEGYRDVDKQAAQKHLNEIAAALQKEESVKVIPMPKNKRHGWLIAASLLAVVGTGIYLFTGYNKSSVPLAVNELKSVLPADSGTENGQPEVSKPNSAPAAASGNLALSKAEKKDEIARMIPSQKKKFSPYKETPAVPKPQPEEAPRAATAYAAPTEDNNSKDIEQKPPTPVVRDTVAQSTGTLSEVVVTRMRRQENKQKGYLTNTWTNDKGKPFLLSEVEVIHIGKKTRKQSDTSAITPEGGWLAFQDYLFSRLTTNDSLSLVKNNAISGDVELEFTVDTDGSPHDVKVIHAQDSALSDKIIHAIQSGPKWKSSDRIEKRLRLKY